MSAVLKGAGLALRPMAERDLAGVQDIERRSYEFPWSSGIFADCLRVGYCCWVVEVDGMLGGYAIMAVGAGESHILNVCVDPDFRRCGIGTAVLERLATVAREHFAETVYLEVRPSNVSAIEMYRRMGFGQIGVRRDYYPASGGREDALVLSRGL